MAMAMDLSPEELQRAIYAAFAKSSEYQQRAALEPAKEELYLQLSLGETQKFSYLVALQHRPSSDDAGDAGEAQGKPRPSYSTAASPRTISLPFFARPQEAPSPSTLSLHCVAVLWVLAGRVPTARPFHLEIQEAGVGRCVCHSRAAG